MRTDAGSADASVLGEAGAADVPVAAHLPSEVSPELLGVTALP